MPEKQTNTWQQNMLGLTFRYADGRISVFKSALEAIGRPEFYHFLYNPAKQMPRTKGSKNRATTSVDFDAPIKKLQKDKAMSPG